MLRFLYLASTRLLFCILLLAAAPLVAQSHDQDIVLVSNAEASIEPLSSLDLRKLFLGLPVRQEGVLLEPIIFQPDDRFSEVFLQAVVGMTARSYDRKVLQSRLNFGANIVDVETNAEQLNQKLQGLETGLSFVRYADAQRFGLKPIQTLWQNEEN